MSTHMKWATVTILVASWLGASATALALQDQPGGAASLAARTIPVPGGNNAAANGRKLLQAVADIEASPAKPVRVKLGKAIYDLRGKSLQVSSGMSLEGAGKDSTRIVADGGATNAQATVAITGPATLAKVTVVSRGARQANAVAILVRSSRAEVEDVKAIAKDAKVLNYGIRIADSDDVELRGVTASATGGAYAYGVSVRDTAKAVFADVQADASGPGENYGVFALNELDLPEMSLNLDHVQGHGRRGKASHGFRVDGQAAVEVADSSFAATQAESNFGLSSHGPPLLFRHGGSIGRGLKIARSKVCGKDVDGSALTARRASPRVAIKCEAE